MFVRTVVTMSIMSVALVACSVGGGAEGGVYPACVESFASERSDFEAMGLGDRHVSYVREGCSCVRDDVIPLLSRRDQALAADFFKGERSLRNMSDGDVIAFQGALQQISSCLNDALREEGLMQEMRRLNL